MEQLAARVNANPRLVWRGRYVDTVFLLEVGEGEWLIQIAAGRIVAVTAVQQVMPSWTFALRASREAWMQFWQPVPRPGFHDLMAMVKCHHLRLEGDLYPLMSNLLYFKDVMATLRGVAS